MKWGRKPLMFVIFIINFYCENCCSQNKCWILFSNLILIINDKNFRAKKIYIKYLEKGHTYMASDLVHGNITKKLNNEHNIYNYEHLLSLIEKS